MEYSIHQDSSQVGSWPRSQTICVIDRRSGYVPNADALKAIAEVVKRLKSRDPELVYLLDRGLSLHRTYFCG